MLEKPALPEAHICQHLCEAYGLPGAQVEFLPLGADVNTAVFRVETAAVPYFLKLRRGSFESISVEVPHWLHHHGIAPILAALETRAGRLWSQLGDYTSMLYPFIAGRSGFEVALSAAQWQTFGAALKGLHTAALPPGLLARLPRETYSPHWRAQVRGFLAQVEQQAYTDPLAAEMAAFMRARRAEIGQLVERAEALSRRLQARPLAVVPCHADIHAGNLLLAGTESVHIVDWDTLLLAPKERDLMLIGAGIGGRWHSPSEAAHFYRGYGPAEPDPTALAYYRGERIVQDIAAYCEQILAGGSEGADREQGFRYFSGQFLPGAELEIARQTDQAGAL